MATKRPDTRPTDEAPRTRGDSQLRRELKKERPFDSPHEEAVLNLLRTSDLFQIRYTRLFAQYGLTSAQYNVLRILRGAGRLPILEIAGRLLAIVPGITGLIDRLEGKDLVRRERCPDDRRVVYVAITPPALALLSQLDEPVRDLNRRLVDHLAPGELSELSRLLEKARQPLLDDATP